jgi:8-amino-7-oxononanoate synthase
VDACRLSRARVVVVPSHDVGAVDAALAARAESRAMVVTDSVGSADGELAPLSALLAVCRARRATLLADEAHGLGVRGAGGRGLAAELGLAGAPELVLTATLSKSLGSQGGVVLATPAVVEHLVNVARPFIFDTALAPAAAGAALAALRVLNVEPALPERVLAAAAAIATAAGVREPSSAVTSVILGATQRAVDAAAECLARGVLVGCFRPPSVPESTSRLRLTAHAGLSGDDLARVADVLTAVLAGDRG